MILRNSTDNQIIQTGQSSQSIDMGLDMQSMQHLMMLLSTNLYSDNIGTPIQELASNALDSHREAGIKDPIIVSLKQESWNQYTFSVEDFGLGLDDQDFINIISKYGMSTKRENADLLGAMGIGAKSPFSYTDSYYFICRKNGVERKYLMYKGDEGFKIDLIHQQDTLERNGVKVAYSIKSRDYSDFVSAIKSKMAYFDNVRIELPNESITEFTIFRSEDFQTSSLYRGSELHLCLDNIVYPISWQKLGITPINVKLALRFSLTDGIMPTPNRESIVYSENSKKIILDKIKKVAEFMINKYNQESIHFQNIFDVYNYYNDQSRYVQLPEMDSKLKINDLVSYSLTPLKEPVVPGVNLIRPNFYYTMRYDIFSNWEIVSKISRNKYTGKIRLHNHGQSIWHMLVNRDKLMIKAFDYSLRMINYLKDQYSDLYFIRKKQERKLPDYKLLLTLRNYPKDTWREVIQEFQAMEKLLLKNIPREADVRIPQSWIDAKKAEGSHLYKSKKVDRNEGQIAVHFSMDMKYPHPDWSCKFEPRAVNIADMPKQPKLFVYGTEKNRKELDIVYRISRKNERVQPVYIGALEQPKIANKFHNWINIHEFMKGKNRLFKVYATAYAIQRYIDEHTWFFNTDNIETIEKFSVKMATMLKELKYYAAKNNNCGDDDLQPYLVVQAKEHKLWDMSIYPTLEEVQKVAPLFDFLEVIKIPEINRYNRETTTARQQAASNIIKELLKARKFRMDYTVYLPDFNVNALDIVEQIISEIPDDEDKEEEEEVDETPEGEEVEDDENEFEIENDDDESEEEEVDAETEAAITHYSKLKMDDELDPRLQQYDIS